MAQRVRWVLLAPLARKARLVLQALTAQLARWVRLVLRVLLVPTV
jgi:hypothetical protein